MSLGTGVLGTGALGSSAEETNTSLPYVPSYSFTFTSTPYTPSANFSFSQAETNSYPIFFPTETSVAQDFGFDFTYPATETSIAQSFQFYNPVEMVKVSSTNVETLYKSSVNPNLRVSSANVETLYKSSVNPNLRVSSANVEVLHRWPYVPNLRVSSVSVEVLVKPAVGLPAVTINQLPDTTTTSEGDLLPIVQAGVTRRATKTELLRDQVIQHTTEKYHDYGYISYGSFTPDCSNSNNHLTTIFGAVTAEAPLATLSAGQVITGHIFIGNADLYPLSWSADWDWGDAGEPVSLDNAAFFKYQRGYGDTKTKIWRLNA